MLLQKNSHNFKIILILLSIITIHGCNNNDNLAVVGDRIVKTADYYERLNQQKTKLGLPDNGKVRAELMRAMVAENVFINEAIYKGYDEDFEGRYEKNRIEIQELLKLYYKNKIAKTLEIDEGDLKKLFVDFNTKLKARHLFAPTKEKADSLYRLVKSGKTFEELAKNAFKDPKLKDTGGMLGYFTVDETDPAFEEAAFLLNIGDVSTPVKTSAGYSIIKVEDRVTKPFLTEMDYAKIKPKLRTFERKRKLNRHSIQFTDSISQLLEISFNENNLNKLYTSLVDSEIEVELKEGGSLPEELLKEELVKTRNESWLIRDFQEKAIFTSQKQRSLVTSKNKFKEFISGLLVRSYMLKEAKKLNLHESEDYSKKVDQKFEDYLLKRIETNLFTEFEIPKDSLKKYYDEDPVRYADPPKIKLKEIVLNDESIAKTVEKELNNGLPFSKMAQKYSINKWSGEKGGDIGYLTGKELGDFSEQIFSLKIGAFAGPIKINSFFAFFKCEDKIPLTINSIDDVKENVENDVRMIMWGKVREMKLNEIKKRVSVKVYPEQIKLSMQ